MTTLTITTERLLPHRDVQEYFFDLEEVYNTYPSLKKFETYEDFTKAISEKCKPRNAAVTRKGIFRGKLPVKEMYFALESVADRQDSTHFYDTYGNPLVTKCLKEHFKSAIKDNILLQGIVLGVFLITFLIMYGLINLIF